MTKKTVNTSVEEHQNDVTARRAKGEFVRGVSGFRNALAETGFEPEPGRYHLFVAFNCPWCHRVTLARNILGLQDSISLNVVFPSRTNDDDPVAPNLWEFNPSRIASLTGMRLVECTLDTATGKEYRLIKEIYAAEGASEGSVPVLYDKKTKRIVNNESAEIIRMLNEHATALKSTIDVDRPDLYPKEAAVRKDIDALNTIIYTAINNGAYKAGFSTDQAIYAQAFEIYFDTLAKLESRLASDGRPFLTGGKFTEADLRLFPTLYRHDPVYYVRMKLNAARIVNYPYLWRWLCRVYAMWGVAQSNSLDHCKQGYFGRSWNNVIPIGPRYPMSYPEAYKHPELIEQGFVDD